MTGLPVRSVFLIGLVALTAPAYQTLTPAVAGGQPAFEVASVKRNLDPDAPRLFQAQPGGGVNLLNQTVRQLIYSAYQLQDYQVLGGPEWLSTDRFDIVAKAAGAAPLPERLLMVRTLLADRFRLQMHAETRELPVYSLVMARSDARLGPRLKPSTCVPVTGVAPPPQGTQVCGNQVGAGTMSVRGNTMNGLANQLGRLPAVGRPVINRTGLEGTFDYELTFTPDSLTADRPADTVSILTALQEQLNLKLEAERGSVSVLVIDSVAPPTPD